MNLSIQRRKQLVGGYNKRIKSAPTKADLIRELAAKYGISNRRAQDIVREVE